MTTLRPQRTVACEALVETQATDGVTRLDRPRGGDGRRPLPGPLRGLTLGPVQPPEY